MGKLKRTESLLFLDDLREPKDVYEYVKDEVYLRSDWIIVRSYDEFVAWIKANGLPEMISFDHDLAPSHYTPQHLWDDYKKSKEWQDAQVHTEGTGFDCVVWLVGQCVLHKTILPKHLCHSQNPVGKDKIMDVLNWYNYMMKYMVKH